MALGYRLTQAAETDVVEIIQYLAERSDDAAQSVFRALEDAFNRLASHPHIGHAREDLTARPVKFLSVFSYLVVYAPETSPLQIIRVLHGARDVGALMKKAP